MAGSLYTNNIIVMALKCTGPFTARVENLNIKPPFKYYDNIHCRLLTNTLVGMNDHYSRNMHDK